MRTQILAIDPGNEKSGVVRFEVDDRELYGVKIIESNGAMDNENLLEYIVMNRLRDCWVAIETPKPMGMAVAGQTMETLIFIGRLCETVDNLDKQHETGIDWSYVFRMDVKLHLCGQSRAKDTNVTQAIKDRFGGCQKPVKCDDCKGRGKSGRGKAKAPCEPCSGTGLDKIAGPLHGITKHAWQAMGVGLWFRDNRLVQRKIINPGGKDNRESGIKHIEFDQVNVIE